MADGSSEWQFDARAAVPSSMPATPAAAVGAERAHNDVTHGRKPCLCGLSTPIAYSRARTSKAAAGGSRAGDALNGHEQSASVLVHNRARAVVDDVRREALGALKAPAWETAPV